MESLTFYTVFSFRRSLQLLSNGKIPLARLGQSTPHDKSCVAVSRVFLYKLSHIAVVPVQLRVKVSWSHTNRSASVFYLVFFSIPWASLPRGLNTLLKRLQICFT